MGFGPYGWGYDIISVDAYRPPYIPWHMTTLEFFQIVHENLSEDGVMVINIGRSPVGSDIDQRSGYNDPPDLSNHLCDGYPDSFNTILFATKQPGSWENFYENYNACYSELMCIPLVGSNGDDDHIPAANT
jgi:hypothetical protein